MTPSRSKSLPCPTELGIAEWMSLNESSETALFDVREAGEAERGHIPGATMLPRRLIEFRIPELVPKWTTPIHVYDDGRDDVRAELAAARLVELGYQNVRVLSGGVAAFEELGGALAHGSNVPSKRFAEELVAAQAVPDLAASELMAFHQDGAPITVCDIRTPEEYRRARMPGAYCAPNFEIGRSIRDLARSDKMVIVHCAGRTRSIIACQTLRLLGLNNVYALRDGTMGWILADQQLEKGAGRGDLTPSSESYQEFERLAGALACSEDIGKVDADELCSILRKRANGALNAYVFDIRRMEKFLAGHVPGATALPGGQAVLRADDFIPIRGATIVLVDDREGGAALAAYWLKQLGYPNACVLEGGVEAWQASGRDVAKGRSRHKPLGLEQAERVTRFVTPSEAETMIGTPDVKVLNVDHSQNFQAGSIPGSHWVPRGSLEQMIGEIAPELSTKLIVSCRHGQQSCFANETLVRLGYRDTAVVRGGTTAWADQGLATDHQAPAAAQDSWDMVLAPFARGREGMLRYLDWEKRLHQSKEPDHDRSQTKCR